MEIKNYYCLIWIMVLFPLCVTGDLYGKCGVKSITVTTLMLLLFVFSCLTFALTPTAEDEITFIECGDIVPVDPYFFIGEKLIFKCALWNDDASKTASLYFDTAVNNNGTLSHVEVNQTGYEIIQLNSTAIQLISPVLTIDDALRHNVSRSYRCMVREAVNSCTESSKKFVSNVHVIIDYYPHSPENFSCHVYNWETLICTWYMLPYFHQADISVEVFWKSDLDNGDSSNWGSNFTEKTFTSFTMNDFNMMPKYWFYFNITNTIRNVVNTSTMFDISPYNIIKPAQVDFISFQNISDTCVTVLWNHSKSFRQKVFEVRYTSKCSSEQQRVTTRNSNITVCNLNPYTTYIFVVDSRPLDLVSKVDTVGFTSDPRDSLHTTKPAVPAANPRLLSYTDETCPDKHCRKILVYWKPLSSCNLHDSPSSQQYEIITKQRGSEETWNFIVNNSEATSHSLTLPDKEKVYEVKLRVITGHGKKREDFSHLVIWPKSQSPIAPSIVVEYATMKDGTEFYITLNLNEAQSQTTQILYWCRGPRQVGCQEAMSYKKINGSSEQIFIENYTMDFNIKFGMESKQNLSGEITTSGIKMASCIYQKDLRPLIPPRNFFIAKGIIEREGELSLEWDPYDCNKHESGYVLSYNLHYCQVTDESSCNWNLSKHSFNTISIKQNNHEYTIRELKPGGRYKVWLTARTSAGEGPISDVFDTYIYIQDFPLWAKVMIGVGSLITSLVILICFVKFKDHLKKRRDVFGNIQVPDTNLPLLITSDYIQIPLANGFAHQQNGHVVGDNQSDEPIPDMDENEELSWKNGMMSNGKSQIPLANGFAHQQNGHVVGDDQSDEPIPDMDENEELSWKNGMMPNGKSQVRMTSNSSSTSLSLDDQIKWLLDIPFLGEDDKNHGPYISSNDIYSAHSDNESESDIRDEKEIKPGTSVMAVELGDQNTNLLPEDYCRAVAPGNYVASAEVNPVPYEQRLDKKLYKLQGQAVHSQSIDSLLNDNPELQRPNLLHVEKCKEYSCERKKDIHSAYANDSSYLPQKHVFIEKHIKTIQMMSKDDFESNELSLSGDDFESNELSLSGDDFKSNELSLSCDDIDAALDDPLSLLDEICRSLNKKASGYIPAHEVHDDGEPLLNSVRHADYAHLDDAFSGSSDDHMRSETSSVRLMDNTRSETSSVRLMDNTRSETSSVRLMDNTRSETAGDEIIPTDTDDHTVITNDNSVKTVADPEKCGDNFERSCVDSLRTYIGPGKLYDDSLKVDDCDSTVMHHNQNGKQNRILDDQQKLEMVTFLSQKENNGPQINKQPLKKGFTVTKNPNAVQNGIVRLPLDMNLLKRVGNASNSNQIQLPATTIYMKLDNL